MTRPDVRPRSTRRAFAAVMATSVLLAAPFAVPIAWTSSPRAAQEAAGNVIASAWHDTAVDPAAFPPGAVIWSFTAPQQAGGKAWEVERGRMTPGASDAQVRPDTSRRVILVSPGGLPEAVRDAETFVVGVVGLAGEAGDAGLQRMRVQGRRDARGGWITIADGKGTALRSTSSGIAVTRTAGSRNQPIESLRIEMTFRTTNPRGLVSIAAVPGPR